MLAAGSVRHWLILHVRDHENKIKTHVSIFTVDSIFTDILLVLWTAECGEFYQGLGSGKNTLLVILPADCGEFQQGLNSGENGR